MAISQGIHQSSMTKINMKINHLKCHQNLPGANELTQEALKSYLLLVFQHVQIRPDCHLWSHEYQPGPITLPVWFNTLRPRQNGRHFPDAIFQCIFLNENVWILIKISLKFVPKGPINKIPALLQIMSWPWPGNKPLSESKMATLLTHFCTTRPQWVKNSFQWLVWQLISYWLIAFLDSL